MLVFLGQATVNVAQSWRQAPIKKQQHGLHVILCIPDDNDTKFVFFGCIQHHNTSTEISIDYYHHEHPRTSVPSGSVIFCLRWTFSSFVMTAADAFLRVGSVGAMAYV